MKEHQNSFFENDSFHSPGAVEGGDSVAIILSVLEKLHHIISGDDTNGNVAGGDHFDDVSGG